jgi:hypothetical protein
MEMGSFPHTSQWLASLSQAGLMCITHFVLCISALPHHTDDASELGAIHLEASQQASLELGKYTHGPPLPTESSLSTAGFGWS